MSANEETNKPVIVVIGGTGAQGSPVVHALAADGKYILRVLTRDVTSPSAQRLASLPNVRLLQGSYLHDPFVLSAFSGAHGAFVNTDGFALGEQAEIFVGMRLFELAVQARVRHYVWGALDYSFKIGGHDPAFRCGHYDGKGRVSEWLLAQKGLFTVPSIYTTGPYLDMLKDGAFVPKLRDNGKTVVFTFPLGDGTVPMIALDDIGVYARWIFDHFDESAYVDLKVATAQVTMHEIVRAFNSVHAESSSGIVAVYEPFSAVADWLTDMVPGKDVPVTAVFGGSNVLAPGMTFHQNFAGFATLWRSGRVVRDYELLDRIHPTRIRSVEEWIRKHGYDGRPARVLKDMHGVNGRVAWSMVKSMLGRLAWW